MGEHLPRGTWPALATIYVAWGSTFLATSVAVRTLPPFLAMSMRHVVAGALLLAWGLLRADREPIGRRELGAAVIFGGALFVGGHGALAWSQQRIPSGVAALVIGSIPLWVALFDRVAFGRRLSWRAVVGLVVGFAGVALLVDPRGGGALDVAGVLVSLAAAASWAAGSLYSRGAPLPSRPIVAAGLAGLAGGLLLAVVALARGELADVDPASVSRDSLLGVAYLIVVGSLVGFSSYVWLLRAAPISLVATYAYVNPVIAVLLGWALLDEIVDARVLLAGGAIVAAVALIVSAPAPERETGRGVLRRPAREPSS
ncbi:MAG TPA: EamA family transporter [Gaiellaceae bacterium]|nr:EamA family transporter [Gaiellaceae bacterium]